MKPDYAGKKTVYFFDGEDIPPPPPGSYDPKHFTPDTKKRYRVEFDDGGQWVLLQGNVTVKTGFGSPSRKAAQEIVGNWIEYVETIGK